MKTHPKTDSTNSNIGSSKPFFYKQGNFSFFSPSQKNENFFGGKVIQKKPDEEVEDTQTYFFQPKKQPNIPNLHLQPQTQSQSSNLSKTFFEFQIQHPLKYAARLVNKAKHSRSRRKLNLRKVQRIIDKVSSVIKKYISVLASNSKYNSLIDDFNRLDTLIQGIRGDIDLHLGKFQTKNAKDVLRIINPKAPLNTSLNPPHGLSEDNIKSMPFTNDEKLIVKIRNRLLKKIGIPHVGFDIALKEIADLVSPYLKRGSRIRKRDLKKIYPVVNRFLRIIVSLWNDSLKSDPDLAKDLYAYMEFISQYESELRHHRGFKPSISLSSLESSLKHNVFLFDIEDKL